MKALVAIAAGAALALSGCGEPSPEERIEQVVERGARAVGAQDAEALCSIMTDQGKRWTVEYMSRVNPQNCEEAAAEALRTLSPENRAKIAKTRAVKVSIVGESARVWISPRIVNGVPQPIPFTLTPQGWRAG